jgi:hypothetical protein
MVVSGLDLARIVVVKFIAMVTGPIAVDSGHIVPVLAVRRWHGAEVVAGNGLPRKKRRWIPRR